MRSRLRAGGLAVPVLTSALLAALLQSLSYRTSSLRGDVEQLRSFACASSHLPGPVGGFRRGSRAVRVSRLIPRLAIGWTMGTLVSALGVYLSLQIDLPTGATIVCAFGLVLILMAAMRGMVRKKVSALKPELVKS